MPAVPAHILPQLAEKQQFRCPYCHNIQNVSLAPEVAHQIMSKQRQDDWHKQNAENAKQRQQQAEWALASNTMQQELAAGAASQYYSQVLLCLTLSHSLPAYDLCLGLKCCASRTGLSSTHVLHSCVPTCCSHVLLSPVVVP